MATRANIVIPGDDPPQIAGSPHLDRLRALGDVTLYDTRPSDTSEQMARVADCDVIINSRGAVTWREQQLKELPKLRMIATCSIGTDMIDIDAARDCDIVVSNQPGRTAPVVAEHMFGLMFAVAKRAAFQTAQIRAGQWPRRMNHMVQGKVLGIIGTGNIGAELARLGKAIGMEVIAWTFRPSPERAADLGVRFVELDELLKIADVISLNVALTEDTHHMIGQEQLAMMKPDAILLNGARGDVLDIDALAASLDSGHLAGAGLDVFAEEPFASDHPIKACEQVVFTPHAADQTLEGIDLLNEGAVDNVIAFLEGNPRNNVAA
jgi:phosphoglycerate dehydrogenase-like enzyme